MSGVGVGAGPALESVRRALAAAGVDAEVGEDEFADVAGVVLGEIQERLGARLAELLDPEEAGEIAWLERAGDAETALRRLAAAVPDYPRVAAAQFDAVVAEAIEWMGARAAAR